MDIDSTIVQKGLSKKPEAPSRKKGTYSTKKKKM